MHLAGNLLGPLKCAVRGRRDSAPECRGGPESCVFHAEWDKDSAMQILIQRNPARPSHHLPKQHVAQVAVGVLGPGRMIQRRSEDLSEDSGVGVREYRLI